MFSCEFVERNYFATVRRNYAKFVVRCGDEKKSIFPILAVSLFVLFGLAQENNAQQKKKTVPTPLAEIERVEIDKTEAVYACSCRGFIPRIPNGCGLDENGEIKKDNLSIKVKTIVRNPKNLWVVYEYTVTGGRIFGQGDQIVWDLEGVRPGAYQITASIKGKRGVSPQTKTQWVKLSECPLCHCPCICPKIMEVTGKETVRASESLVFTVNILGGTFTDINYNWTVSQGEIVNGQGTPQIKVKTTREMSGFVKATVQVEGNGLCESCPREMSYSTDIVK
jgi:PKD-like domain